MRCDYALLVLASLAAVQFLLLAPDGQAFSRDGLAPGEAAFVGQYHVEAKTDDLPTGQSRVSGPAKVLLYSQHTDIHKLAVSRAVVQLQGPVGGEFATRELVFHSGLGTDGEFRFLGDVSSLQLAGLGETSDAESCPVEARFRLESVDETRMLEIEIWADDAKGCRFRIRGELALVDVEKNNGKVGLYVCIANMLIMAQYKVVVGQIESMEVNNVASRMAPWTVLLQMTMDVFDAMLHLMLGLIGRHMFSTLAMTAFFKFVLFSVLEARLLVYTVRARLGDDAQIDTLSSAVRGYYGKFHMLILLVTVWILLVPGGFTHTVWLYGCQLYWLPQIALGVMSGQKPSLTYTYIIIMALTRLYTPVYMFGQAATSQSSFLDGQLYPAVSAATSTDRTLFTSSMVLATAVQTAILILQKRWSPRWFVPLVFLPHVYNYYRVLAVGPAADLEAGEQHECVICMTEVLDKAGRPAVTPCGHVFHASCLADWLEVKMECPTCRRVLPPMT